MHSQCIDLSNFSYRFQSCLAVKKLRYLVSYSSQSCTEKYGSGNVIEKS